MTTFPKVAVIILNWNGKKWLETFLPSVAQTSYPAAEIWITDNGSTDDSVAFVRAQYPQFKILELDKNYGFTEGNNKSLPHIDAPFYVLLNSDVEVSPNWLAPLVECITDDDNIAAVQPKLLAYHAKNHFEHAGGAGGMMDILAARFIVCSVNCKKVSIAYRIALRQLPLRARAAIARMLAQVFSSVPGLARYPC